MDANAGRHIQNQRHGDAIPVLRPVHRRGGAALAFLKVSLMGTGLVVLSLGATIMVTDPDPRRCRGAGSGSRPVWAIVVAIGRIASG